MRPVGSVGMSNVRAEEFGEGVTADGGGGAGGSVKSVVDGEEEMILREERSSVDGDVWVSDGADWVLGSVTRSAGLRYVLYVEPRDVYLRRR